MKRNKKEWTGNDGMCYVKESRWIQIKDMFVTTKHNLAIYGSECEDGYVYVTAFRHSNGTYAMGEVLRIDDPIIIPGAGIDGEDSVLCGYIPLCNFGGLIVEVDKCGEHVRLWSIVVK